MQFFMKINFHLNIKVVGGFEQQENFECSTSKSKYINEYEIELWRSKRPRVEKVFGPKYYVYNLQSDPTSLEEALSSLDSSFWKEAINDEIDSIISNNTCLSITCVAFIICTYVKVSIIYICFSRRLGNIGSHISIKSSNPIHMPFSCLSPFFCPIHQVLNFVDVASSMWERNCRL